MASILNVDQINNAAGTSAISIDSSGNTLIPGHVVQVVSAVYGTQTYSSSQTFASTGLAASITPNSASSKILVVVHQNGVYKDGSNTAGVGIRLMRDATELADFGDRTAGDNNIVNSVGAVSMSYLDAPATTSSVTYETRFKASSNVGGAYVQVYYADSTITLMEIAQ